jgi:hypothetical protein
MNPPSSPVGDVGAEEDVEDGEYEIDEDSEVELAATEEVSRLMGYLAARAGKARRRASDHFMADTCCEGDWDEEAQRLGQRPLYLATSTTLSSRVVDFGVSLRSVAPLRRHPTPVRCARDVLVPR